MASRKTDKKPRGRPRHDDILTPGEWRIVEAIRHGMTSKQIAERRSISVDAVKYHVANILQKLGLTNRAALREWSGVASGSALFSKEFPMESTRHIHSIGQISRSVTDIAIATQWYRDMLHLKHLYSFGDLAFFDCGGVRLFLSQAGEKLPDDSIIYFHVDDIHGTYEDMLSRGITFLNTPHKVHQHEDGTEEWMAFFNDCDGRPLGLMAQYKKEN